MREATLGSEEETLIEGQTDRPLGTILFFDEEDDEEDLPSSNISRNRFSISGLLI